MNVECPIVDCSERFLTALSLLNHVIDYHKTPAHFNLKCTFPACPQFFSKLTNFKKHMLNHRFIKQHEPERNRKMEENDKPNKSRESRGMFA